MQNQESLSPIRLDEVFFGILAGINAEVIATTNKSVTIILDVSMNYLSSAAQDALTSFYSLYFGPGKAQTERVEVNQEVDSLFDQINADFAAGKTEGQVLENLKEDEERKKARLTISGFQKKLESLITLDNEVRGKLVPAMMAMQFEDLLRQRISRIEALWRSIFNVLAGGKDGSLDSLREIGKDVFLASHFERALYHKIVLGQDIGPAIEKNETWFEN